MSLTVVHFVGYGQSQGTMRFGLLVRFYIVIPITLSTRKFDGPAMPWLQWKTSYHWVGPVTISSNLCLYSVGDCNFYCWFVNFLYSVDFNGIS